MFFEYYVYYLYYTFLGFPLVVRFAICAICLYAPFFIYTLIVLNRTRSRFYKENRLRAKLGEKYADKIKEIATSDKEHGFEDIGILLDCNVNRLSANEKKVLSDLLSKLRETLPEKELNRDNYEKLIDYFELRQYWGKKLKYGNLLARQTALRKLDDLDIEIPGSVISALTYNRNPYLRKRARNSFMYYSRSSPYKFFNENFDHTFNQWDKIEVHRTLWRRKDKNIPQFNHWIKNSTNVPFQCFLVDQICFFNQKESIPYLAEVVLNNEDSDLKESCIKALQEMDYADIEEELLKDYVLQPESVQKAIIEAIGKLNTGKHLQFLKEAYYNTHSAELSKIILQTIYNYGNEGQKLFLSMKESAVGFSRLLFSHVANPLIKY